MATVTVNKKKETMCVCERERIKNAAKEGEKRKKKHKKFIKLTGRKWMLFSTRDTNAMKAREEWITLNNIYICLSGDYEGSSRSKREKSERRKSVRR